jgi:hypothetical protein
MFSHVWSSARFKQWRAMMISIEGSLEDEQSLSTGEMLTVNFRQPSHEFIFGVGMNFISYPLVLTPLVQQVRLCMSVLEFNVYAGIYRWKKDFRVKFIKHLVTRPRSPVQVQQWSEHDSKKPKDQPVKTGNSKDPNRKCWILRGKELHLNRGETDVKGHMQ